jgi:hypothetical protein
VEANCCWDAGMEEGAEYIWAREEDDGEEEGGDGQQQ